MVLESILAKLLGLSSCPLLDHLYIYSLMHELKSISMRGVCWRSHIN